MLSTLVNYVKYRGADQTIKMYYLLAVSNPQLRRLLSMIQFTKPLVLNLVRLTSLGQGQQKAYTYENYERFLKFYTLWCTINSVTYDAPMVDRSRNAAGNLYLIYLPALESLGSNCPSGLLSSFST